MSTLERVVPARYRGQLRKHLTAIQGGEPNLAGCQLVIDCAEGAASAFQPDQRKQTA